MGVCGGDCTADADADGICDDVDDCVGELDACGVCNGPGEIYECGCSDIPEGDCDCEGNQLDALGVCGGNCGSDENDNGICDSTELGLCGEDTYWDPMTLQCVVQLIVDLECKADLDDNGLVSSTDLLILLAYFGNDCENP